MVGPLPKAPGGFTHIFVVVDKFTKWIEARPLTKITSAQAVDSFLSILHQFVVPNTIVTDNGTQFTGKKFTQFCDDYGIQVAWAAVAHARTNDQVARANGMIWRVLEASSSPSSSLSPSLPLPLGDSEGGSTGSPRATWRTRSLFRFSRRMFSSVFFFFAACLDSEAKRFAGAAPHWRPPPQGPTLGKNRGWRAQCQLGNSTRGQQRRQRLRGKGEQTYEAHDERIGQHDRLTLGRDGAQFGPVEDLHEARLDLLGRQVHRGDVTPPQNHVVRFHRHLKQTQGSVHERGHTSPEIPLNDA